MRNMLRALFVILVASTPALAQKVTIDYAHDFDFSSVETYAVTSGPGGDPGGQLTDDRTRHAIIRELHRGGLLTTSSDPDLQIEYRLVSADPTEREIITPDAVDFGPGWTGWNGASPAPASTHPAGALVIVASDTATGKLLWRATGTVKATEKPEKRHKKIDKIIAKLGNRWRKILAGEGK